MKWPFIGLMGVKSDGTMVSPNGKHSLKVPMRIACRIQRIQHWIAQKTWR